VAFSSVVFPAPLGPMIPVTWRGAALIDTSSSAVSPPNCTVTPLTSSTPDLGALTVLAESAFISLILNLLGTTGEV
jgi:hypothetical protein